MLVYRALQQMGQMQLYTSEAYLNPSAGFWTDCYRIFEFAEQMQLTKLPVAVDGHERQSIEQLFGSILLFALTSSNQFRPREMQKIFQLLGRAITVAGTEVSADLSQDQSKGLYAFDLHRDAPPVRFDDMPPADAGAYRYFNVLPVARSIHDFLQQPQEIGTGQLRAINSALYTRVVKTLSQVKCRKFTRLRERRNIDGIIGLTNVLNHLRNSQGFALEEKADHTVKIYDPRISGQWGTLDVDLVPLDNEVLFQQPKMHSSHGGIDAHTRRIFDAAPALVSGQQTEIWEQSEKTGGDSGNAVFFDDFAIQDSCILGYSVVCDARNIKVRIGDIIGFLSDKERLEIGLIRRIGAQCPEGKIQLGVELLAMESKLVHLTGPSRKKGLWAMLLPGMKAMHTEDSVVFATCEFRPGEIVKLQRGDGKVACRLKKLINSTATVSQMTLEYLPGNDDDCQDSCPIFYATFSLTSCSDV